MPDCLIIQPIHERGMQVLRDAGITPRPASASDMPTVAREMGEAVAAITRNAGFSRAALDAAPRLRVIGNHGIGTDPVDVARATELGIPARYGRLSARELREAEEAFITSTTCGLVPITRVDSRTLSGGRPGPVTAQLLAEYYRRKQAGWRMTPIAYD